ncbi:MAG: hypothetical protein PHF29_08025 [Candidatus Riflebacteria bacterium]|nr:hypothetical protein [Candidatus Riflebacteria bacterium]
MTNNLGPVQQLKQIQMQLEAIQKKDMARLGDGSMFWITEGPEKKRGFRAKVELTYPDQFCFIMNKPMICAQGFDKANQYAGIEVIRPKTVTIEGGKEVGNPYFEKDQNGALVSIFIRGIGIGYNPTGSLAIVDQTVFVNLNTLLVQEVQAKLKYDPTIATLGIQNEKPKEFIAYSTTWNKQSQKKEIAGEKTVEVKGAWHFLPVHSNMGYWVNLAHPDIQAAFEGFTQKQRFLERTATTVLKRLILSTHPAIAAKTPIVTCSEKGRERAHIIVYGFRADEGDAKKKREEMEALAAKLSAGEAAADLEVVQTEIKDIATEAEILEPSTVADPTEIPVVEPVYDFEEENIPASHETETVEPVQTAEEVPPLKQLNSVLSDPKCQVACIKVRKDMNTSFSALRTAPDEIIMEFVSNVLQEVAA